MPWLLLACVDPTAKPPDAGGADHTADVGDTADTGAEWLALPATCEPPASLPADPLVLEGQVRVTQAGPSGFLEALDVHLDGHLAYVVGMGGLLVFDVADPAAPVKLAGPWDPGRGKLHRVEPLQAGLVATSQREEGVLLWDVSDPAAPTQVGLIEGEGMEGLAWVGERLWVTVRGEGVRAYDVSDPAAPAERARAAGLSAPWELASTGDGWLYAADNALGVVPVDIRDPDAPVVGAPVSVGGAALHARYDADRLYVAAGGDGVVVLDASDRAAPALLHTVGTGGSAVMTDVADGRLWVADHEGVGVFALGDGAPTPIQRDRTEQFALAVDAEGSRGVVGDWNLFEAWQLLPGIDAGALDLASDTLRYSASTVTATLTNRGSGPLVLHGATVADPGVALAVSAATIAPGETATLRLTGVTGDTTVCLATDDPDEPTRTLDVRASAEPPAGVPAPDFALTDLDGNVHRLSEQLGNPVLLAYFATW